MPLQISKSTRVLLAFAAVYLFWGSTYAGIRIAGEQLSAPVVSASRCILATIFIFAVARLGGKSLRVAPGELWKLSLIGFLFMSVNNMGLTWAEQRVPSGFASLVVASTPLLIALMETALPTGERLNLKGWTGTLLGVAGMAFLVWPSLHQGASPQHRSGLAIFVLLGAALAFGVGAMLARRFQFQTDTLVATGWQLAAAAVFNTLFALASSGLRHSVWTTRGVAAVVYLAVFGSLFGLVAFTYLLKNVPVTRVAPYAFVNPMIAVLLGAFIFQEHLVSTELVGMAIIIAGVAMVVMNRAAPARPAVHAAAAD